MSEPFQLFPDLAPAVESALRSSIEKHGVLLPVFVDQHNRIIDGHQRTRIADELGVDYVTSTVEIRDAEHGRELAATLNMDRRHMDAETRRQVVADLRSEGHSTRAIAEAVGVDAKTVRNDLGPSGEQDCSPDEVLGKDGKRYPATRPTPEPSTDSADVEALTLEPTTEAVNAGQVRAGDTLVDDHGEAHPVVEAQAGCGVTSFQAGASRQGREWEQCVESVLTFEGYSIIGRHARIAGMEVDIVAADPAGETIWIECKGSYMSRVPGLIRDDTTKKLVGVAYHIFLSTPVEERRPYVCITSHLPKPGSVGDLMLAQALAIGAIHQVRTITQEIA